MREIKKDGVVLARHIFPEDFKPGLNFFSGDGEFLQVGVWGHYENGKDLGRHFHNRFERKTYRTYEAVYLISGSLKASVYDLEMNLTEQIEVRAGELLVSLESGHGYVITSDNTTVLEIKNGPFEGVEKDKTLF